MCHHTFIAASFTQCMIMEVNQWTIDNTSRLFLIGQFRYPRFGPDFNTVTGNFTVFYKGKTSLHVVYLFLKN